VSIASLVRAGDRAACFACRSVLVIVLAWGPSATAADEGHAPPASGPAAEPAAPIPSARWTSTPIRPRPGPDNSPLALALAAHRNRPVLINFWASWCPPCRDELPDLQRFAQAVGPNGLVVLTVAVADRRPAVDAVFRELGVELPVVLDPDQAVSRAWGAFGLPTSVLLDRRHRIRYRALGVVDWQAEPTRQAVAKVMAMTR
jgi:thiol-disulfide isomerase/thioredoxin